MPKWIATKRYTMISIVGPTNFNTIRYARITTYLLPAGIRIRAIWKARPVHHARRHEYRERAENSNMQSLFRTSSFRVLFKIICLIYAHINYANKKAILTSWLVFDRLKNRDFKSDRFECFFREFWKLLWSYNHQL